MSADTPPSSFHSGALPPVPLDIVEQTIRRLRQAHGDEKLERIRRGVEQVAQRWWVEDGEAAEFEAFCVASFLAEETALERAVQRLGRVLEQVDGHLHEVRRELMEPLEVEPGPAGESAAVGASHAEIAALDRLFVRLDLAPHVDEDLFRSRVAFFALLNFPVHTLRERLALSPAWGRADWARSRMMDRFASRVPAAAAQAVTRALTAAEEYISGYNIRADRLVGPGGERPFREGLRLISHWGLRDELAAHYADPQRDAALDRQRLLLKVMERIVRQEIPAAVIDNPDLLWSPVSNEVRPLAAAGTGAADGAAVDPEAREPDLRYAHMLALFHAQRAVDPYTPTAPSLPARRFDVERQMPEEEVEALLVTVLDAPEIDDLAREISRQLGRPLEPFDIWYSGFKSRSGRGETELDAKVRSAFPTLADFAVGMPDLLQRLGFQAERAAWLAERIVVDRARGAGHALGAVRREDRAHLRTRIGDDGMDYKGYNVAMHELGHNVEQVFSLNAIDHWWLAGVPNNAFTEAFAFMFQERDLEMLGLADASSETYRSRALASLWNTYEISGVSLVDMRVWRWLYAHPDATPASLREATLAIARDVWNRWFAPRLAHPDCEILAIYSHMIAYALYLPDYALGHIVAFQMAARLLRPPLGAGAFGAEVERCTRQGRLTPDAWMRGAVGGPVSAGALLAAARHALSGAQTQ